MNPALHRAAGPDTPRTCVVPPGARMVLDVVDNMPVAASEPFHATHRQADVGTHSTRHAEPCSYRSS